MKFTRHRSIFLFASCALLMALEAWCIVRRQAAAQEAATRLRRLRAELHSLGGLTPAPTPEVAAAIEADLDRARRNLAAQEAALKSGDSAAERNDGLKMPVTRTDAFYDLASFRERMREYARRRSVAIRPETGRFGFGAYASDSPEADRIPAVFHQRLLAQYLLEALFEACPRSLLQVQREPALTKKERAERDEGTGGAVISTGSVAGSADLFVLDPRLSVRVRDSIDTTAFRFVFCGQTASLRAFLNRIATFKLPMVVREVEVAPATADESAVEESPPGHASSREHPAVASVVLGVTATTEKPANKTAATTPIVARPWSRFTVTVEYIELSASIVAPADAPAKTTPST